ncbi:MAG: response regulator transcription factor [Anaerolineae bacterium]|nr:response regulator transcription factor [Anaerolineae bacterium]
MSNMSNINLKVLIMDSDYYALQAINSYLAWDRRTRVTCMASSLDEMWSYIHRAPLAELPDVVIIDTAHIGGADVLGLQIERLQQKIQDVLVICLAQVPDASMIEASAEAGARGYLLKGEVRLQIAWAIVYALDHDFIITPDAARAGEQIFHPRLNNATVLPRRREYPELTERIRQAIELCVVKGMPAHLAADEMGISLHTIRSYIKEGYRILEAYDETEYPVDMSPQERAFMRLTRFTGDDEEK